MRCYLRVLEYFRADTSKVLLLLVIGLSTLLGLLQVWPLAILVDSVITSTPRGDWMHRFFAGLLPEDGEMEAPRRAPPHGDLCAGHGEGGAIGGAAAAGGLHADLIALHAGQCLRQRAQEGRHGGLRPRARGQPARGPPPGGPPRPP